MFTVYERLNLKSKPYNHPLDLFLDHCLIAIYSNTKKVFGCTVNQFTALPLV